MSLISIARGLGYTEEDVWVNQNTGRFEVSSPSILEAIAEGIRITQEIIKK